MCSSLSSVGKSVASSLKFLASTIGLPPVPDAQNGDGRAAAVEADSIVADAEAELRRIDVLQTFDVAGTAFSETFNRLLDPARNALFEASHVIDGCLGPCNLHSLQPEPAHGLSVRNAFATI
jgi:hypothetical protein